MSGAGVGGCTACGGGPGWEAETWLIESPTPLASWARATPETKRRRQRKTVSLVFMTSPQGKITVTSLLFYDRLDCRLPPSRREEHPQEGRPTKSALGTAPAAAWARAHGGRQEAGDQEAQSLGVESKRGGGKISAKHTLAGTRSRVGPANAWRFTMKALGCIAYVLLLAVMPACATTSTTSSEWGQPRGRPEWVRYGIVTNIRQVIQRREGNPAGGAVAGAIIGGILGGGRGPGALVGAAGGAAVGAAASSGSSEQISYELWVRFQDGGYQAFVYANYPPFRSGEPVELTPRGLYPLPPAPPPVPTVPPPVPMGPPPVPTVPPPVPTVPPPAPAVPPSVPGG